MSTPTHQANMISFARYATAILVATLISVPVSFYAAYRTVKSNTNKVADWLPDTFQETNELRWFRQHFSADQFVVVSWDGCRLGTRPDGTDDDPRIERLAQILVDAQAARSAGVSNSEYFKSVTTGRRLLDQLTAPPMNLDKHLALERLQGSVIGPDGRQTCVVVSLTDQAITDLRAAVGRGVGGPLDADATEGELLKAIHAAGIDPDRAYLGGPPIDNVAIDEEGERTLVRLAGVSGVVGLLLAGWSLRSLRLTAIVFACGILAAANALAAVWLTGGTSDAVLLSMPALVYVLAISGAIHLINYYRSAVSESGVAGAAGRAIRRGAKPAILCSVTTAIGLLSLCASDLVPIRKFGIYAAIGVVLTLLTLFLFLPAALVAWPEKANAPGGRRRFRVRNQRPRRRGIRTPGWLRAPSHDAIWQAIGSWIISHHRIVTLTCASVIATAGWGITRAESTIDLMKLFDREARILNDYRWLEANVGRLVPMEIVLRFDHAAVRDREVRGARKGLTLLDRMHIVSEVEQALEQEFGAAGQGIVGPPTSAITFVPPVAEPQRGLSAVLRRSAWNSKVEQAYGALQNSGYLRVDKADDRELWRISLRVAAFENVDYGRFSNELQKVVAPVIARANQEAAAATEVEDQPLVDAVYTGVIPIVYKAQRALLDSLIESTMWSFLTIAPLLMIISRGVRAGIVTMLPNVLPLFVIFGGMGWLGLPIDIGSMMSASIALGVAVDDTIHYLTWFRHDLDQSRCRNQAVLAAYRHCATPTMQAALINGFGLAVFAFSTFTPTKQFGFLMLTILIAGVIAELILLPALLAGPLGRVFQPSPPATTTVSRPTTRDVPRLRLTPIANVPRGNHSILRR